jgi:hypothetical protein
MMRRLKRYVNDPVLLLLLSLDALITIIGMWVLWRNVR